MKKMIIEEHAEKHEYEIGRIRQYVEAVNKVLERFKEQTGYSPTMEDVKEIIMYQTAMALTVNLDYSLESQFNKMKVTNKVMRDNMKANTQSGILELIKQISGIIYTNARYYLHNLTMEAGKLTLTEDEAETIRNSFRNYVTSEKGTEFYELHTAAAQYLSNFFSFIRENTPLRPFSIDEYFSLCRETGMVECEELEYERCIQHKPELIV